MAYLHNFSTYTHTAATSNCGEDSRSTISINPSNGQLSKRMMDIVVSLSLLILLLPFLIGLAIAVKLSDGGTPIFRQRRIGLNGEEFFCLKFRTMVPNADKILAGFLAANPQAAAEWALDQKLRQDPRVTRIGEFLRKTSLDELPQLWNILKGEMSLVGPRPIVDNEQVKYGEYLPYYKSVLPGVTGLWQVSGRNDTTYEERVMLDVQYASTRTTLGDIGILFRTIPAVLLSRGAY